MKHDPQRDELQRLISALLDDRLSPEEHARLEALLAADPQARLLYMQRVDQEIELPCLVAALRETGPAPAPSARGNFGPAWGALRFLWRPWFVGIACALSILAVLAVIAARGWLGKSPSPSPTTTATLPSVSQSWAEDFENGAAPGWHGRIVTTDLPAGSQYGIAAIVKEYPGSSSYNIHLPENWERGFVALTPESTLHVTYRLGQRTHVNIFMHTISPEPGERKYEMFQLRPGGGFPGRGGRWQTASIPFSSFVRKISVEPGGSPQFVGGPPRDGELVAALSFSSLEPGDLVIDRVWIAPSGPAREEIVPLQN